MACPVCDKPSDPACRPFCSKRCADVDLHRWLNEGYRLPGEASEDEEESAPERNNAREDD